MPSETSVPRERGQAKLFYHSLSKRALKVAWGSGKGKASKQCSYTIRFNYSTLLTLIYTTPDCPERLARERFSRQPAVSRQHRLLQVTAV